MREIRPYDLSATVDKNATRRMTKNTFNRTSIFFSVQLDSGQFPEQSSDYQRWKEWRDKVAAELRQSVSTVVYKKSF